MRTKRARNKKHAKHTARALLIETPIYALLVTIYFFTILHFLGDWLGQTQREHYFFYALVALGLMIGQAVMLEFVTTLLLRFFQGGRSE